VSTQADHPELELDGGFLSSLRGLRLEPARVGAVSHVGERAARQRGLGHEFSDHRPYAPGDDIRAVDWNVFRRHQKLFVRQHQGLLDESVLIVLDASASMRGSVGRKFLRATELALGLVHVALLSRMRVALYVAHGGEVQGISALRHVGDVPRAIPFLRNQVPRGPTDLSAGLAAVLRRERSRGLAVVITDRHVPGAPATAIRLLQRSRMEPWWIEVDDEPDFDGDAGGEVILIDAETGEERPFFLDAVALAQVQQHRAAEQERRLSALRARGVSACAVPIVSSVLDSFRALFGPYGRIRA
jgi:uncharacterized protein (DUF58 family)